MPNRMSPDKDVILRGLGAEVVRAPSGQERSNFSLPINYQPDG